MALEYSEAFDGLTEKEKMFTYYMFKAIAAGWRVPFYPKYESVDYGCSSVEGNSLPDFPLSADLPKGISSGSEDASSS